MGLVAPILLLSFGSIMMLFTAFFGLGGYPLVIKTALNIIVNLLPDMNLRLWMEIPIPIALQVSLANFTTVADSDGQLNLGGMNDIFPGVAKPLGTGRLDFEIGMDQWEEGVEDKLVPLIWIQESANVDEIQRYVLGVQPINTNYFIIGGYASLILSFILMPIGGIMYKLKNDNLVSVFKE